MKNVFDENLELCSTFPVTGFFRDGSCKSSEQDIGRHSVCAQVTEEFLIFSKVKGNDLITPNPFYRFPGLKSGDRWCLSALRWLEAYHAGYPPSVVLRSTNKDTLEIIDFDILKRFAIDL